MFWQVSHRQRLDTLHHSFVNHYTFLLYVALCTILTSKHYLHHSIGLDWNGSPGDRRSSLTPPHHPPILHRCRRERRSRMLAHGRHSSVPSVPSVLGEAVRPGHRCHEKPCWCAGDAGRLLRRPSSCAAEHHRLPPTTTCRCSRHRFLLRDRLPPRRSRQRAVVGHAGAPESPTRLLLRHAVGDREGGRSPCRVQEGARRRRPGGSLRTAEAPGTPPPPALAS